MYLVIYRNTLLEKINLLGVRRSPGVLRFPMSGMRIPQCHCRDITHATGDIAVTTVLSLRQPEVKLRACDRAP